MNKENNLKSKFLKVFANIPDKIRSEDIIVVVDGKPYTWDNAAIEVKNDSETGNKILEILKKMGVL